MAVASIVDYLKSRNMDSSYGARKNLASQYGITGYSGTAQQNMSLLKSLQQQSQKSQAAGQQSNANNQNQNVTITPVSDDGKTGPGHPAATYLTDYNYAKFSPSARTTDYADRLDEIENNKPDEYYSKYQGSKVRVLSSSMTSAAKGSTRVRSPLNSASIRSSHAVVIRT